MGVHRNALAAHRNHIQAARNSFPYQTQFTGGADWLRHLEASTMVPTTRAEAHAGLRRLLHGICNDLRVPPPGNTLSGACDVLLRCFRAAPMRGHYFLNLRGLRLKFNSTVPLGVGGNLQHTRVFFGML
jgi:hypothetical protein